MNRINYLFFFIKYFCLYLDNDRGNYRPREERNLDSNEFTSAGRPSNNNYNSETQSRNQQR